MIPTASESAGTVEVQLPVCPECQRVGKIPVDHFGGKEFCFGPNGQSHKKVRMKKGTFRMVEEEA